MNSSRLGGIIPNRTILCSASLWLTYLCGVPGRRLFDLSSSLEYFTIDFPTMKGSFPAALVKVGGELNKSCGFSLRTQLALLFEDAIDAELDSIPMKSLFLLARAAKRCRRCSSRSSRLRWLSFLIVPENNKFPINDDQRDNSEQSLCLQKEHGGNKVS